ncbi:MAG: immunoglobulin domain-containing protein, partial [Verrucomicrobiales bacterium]|nr:immunoglobulin domain-containing protein [Verrucomicrobiales bacterium]
GRILIGGYFTNVLGTVRRGIARLNTDGTLDTSFNPGTGVQGLVKAIRVEADGRILVGGHFYSINGTLRSGLARLSATGTVDATFNAGVGATLAPDDLSLDGPSVDSIVLQGDGRAVVGGNFTGFGGISRRYLARLHWNGDVDEEFDPGDGPDGPVRALALDPDGRLIVAGEFTTIAGVDRPGIARLQNDGTLPVLPSVVTPPESQSVVIGKAATFAVEATGTPALRYQWLKSDLPIADQTNRTLVISASQLSDAGRYSVVIANDAGAITSPSASLTVTPAPVAPTIVSQPTGALVVAGTSVTFEAAASGSKPLVWQWFLGNQPLAGATNESLALDAVTSQNAGSYSARVANGGGSAATSVAPLAVFTPPEDQVAWAGSNATFRVTVAGPGPFGYQWWHEGSPIAGAVKSAYTVTNAQLAIAGEYFVVLSNATSRATSAPALLDVRMKPLVTVPPADTGATNGATVELTVEAIGSEPLSFQWKLHGVDLPDQTNATLTLGPLTSSDAGRYSVVVANAYGSTTSPTATVTVEGPEIARIFVESVESFSGGTLEVPVWLVGVGDENTLAFSLAFDPEVLAFQSISNGLAIGADANVIVNSDAADEGRIGLLVALAPGTTFAAGSNHLATLHLEAVAGLAEATTTPIEFANEPVVPTLLSTAIRPLAVTYEPGTVTLDAGFEGDLSPSPRGDRVLSLEDWSQVALIVAGLAEPADASAFARADCAPVETLGDGVLAAADWTQAGRYAAGIDSPTPTGGPTRRAGSPALLAEAAVAMDESEDTIASLVAADDVPDTGPSRRLASSRNERRIEAESVRVAPATVASVPVRLSAAGDENTAGFTVVADPTRVRILGARRGEGLDRDSTLILNTNAVARGRLGVLLARPVGARFAAGSHEVIRVDLELLGAQSATLGFADSVVRREVASKDARILATTYASGQLTLEAPATPPVPRLPARTRSGAILMRWDATRPGRYTLETSTDLVRWSVVNEWTVAGPSTLEYQDTHPGLSPGRFYRIR